LECLGIESSPCVVSVAGAGGKTTLMYALAGEILSRRRTVVTTTTTKILAPRPQESPCTLLVKDDPELRSLEEKLTQFRHVTVAHSLIPDIGKLEGITDEVVTSCSRAAHYVIVEADGAAGRPIKAPESWEPVVPECTNLVVYMVGLDCVGRPATDQWVFRLDRFLSLTGIKLGDAIRGFTVGRLLSHPDGALKGVPVGVPVIPFLNKADLLTDAKAVDEIAEALSTLAKDRFLTLVIGSMRQFL